jgi:hypothetical protein
LNQNHFTASGASQTLADGRPVFDLQFRGAALANQLKRFHELTPANENDD